MSEITKVLDLDKVSLVAQDIGYSFLYLMILSIIAVNVLFYAEKGSDSIAGKVNGLDKLFPFSPDKWPYCYTIGSEYSECPTEPDKSCDTTNADFGHIHDKTRDKGDKSEGLKYYFLEASIRLEKLIFKMFCLTKEEYEETQKKNDSKNSGEIFDLIFLKTRFKQWINNTLVFHFSKSREYLIKIIGFIHIIRTYVETLTGFGEYIEPFMLIVGLLIFILLFMYFALGPSFLLTIIGMIRHKTQYSPEENIRTYRGGFVWTFMTGMGFMGLIPAVISCLQFVQFLGSFIVYPILNDFTYYSEIFTRYIPMIFFIFNVIIIVIIATEYNKNDNEIEFAVYAVSTVLILMGILFCPKIMEFINVRKAKAILKEAEKAAASKTPS